MRGLRRPSSLKVTTCAKMGCTRSMSSACRVDLRGRYLCSAHGTAAERYWKRQLPVVHKRLAHLLDEQRQYRWILGCLTDELTNQLLKWTSKELSDPNGLWLSPALPAPNMHQTKRRRAPVRALTRDKLAARCLIKVCDAQLRDNRSSWGERDICSACYQRTLRSTQRAATQYDV